MPKELENKMHLIMRLEVVTLLGRAFRLQSHAQEHNFCSTNFSRQSSVVSRQPVRIQSSVNEASVIVFGLKTNLFG
jgi:hypothetical protein